MSPGKERYACSSPFKTQLPLTHAKELRFRFPGQGHLACHRDRDLAQSIAAPTNDPANPTAAPTPSSTNGTRTRVAAPGLVVPLGALPLVDVDPPGVVD